MSHIALEQLAHLAISALEAANLPSDVEIVDDPVERGLAIGTAANIVETQVDESPFYYVVWHSTDPADYAESEPVEDAVDAVKDAVMGIMEMRIDAALAEAAAALPADGALTVTPGRETP